MLNYVVTHVKIKRGTLGSDFVLLVLKDRPEKLKGRLNLVGGKIEDGEKPEEAAIRELKEESGIFVNKAEIYGQINCNDCVIYCTVANIEVWTPAQSQEGETELVRWYLWNEALKDKRLMPNLRVIVPLLMMGVKGWVIEDHKDFVAPFHKIEIIVNNEQN